MKFTFWLLPIVILLASSVSCNNKVCTAKSAAPGVETPTEEGRIEYIECSQHKNPQRVLQATLYWQECQNSETHYYLKEAPPPPGPNDLTCMEQRLSSFSANNSDYVTESGQRVGTGCSFTLKKATNNQVKVGISFYCVGGKEFAERIDTVVTIPFGRELTVKLSKQVTVQASYLPISKPSTSPAKDLP